MVKFGSYELAVLASLSAMEDEEGLEPPFGVEDIKRYLNRHYGFKGRSLMRALRDLEYKGLVLVEQDKFGSLQVYPYREGEKVLDKVSFWKPIDPGSATHLALKHVAAEGSTKGIVFAMGTTGTPMTPIVKLRNMGYIINNPGGRIGEYNLTAQGWDMLERLDDELEVSEFD